jgi:hypothetical protein
VSLFTISKNKNRGLGVRGQTPEGSVGGPLVIRRKVSSHGPSRQMLPRNLMSAFRVLRTLCEADTKQIGSE